MTQGDQGSSPQLPAQGAAHAVPMKHLLALALLRPFCSEREEEYAHAPPFVRSGWLYATDGRVLIRTRSDRPNAADYTPPAEDPEWDAGRFGKPQPIPDVGPRPADDVVEEAIPFAGWHVAPKHLRMIREVGASTIAYHKVPNRGVYRFEGGGFEGILMGCAVPMPAPG